METKTLDIKYRDTDSLVPYAMNSRTHSDGQVKQIAASIKEFGFLSPVLVDASNGIVAGHGRVLAARSIGLEKIPTIEIGHLSDAQRRAFVIADNRLAEGSGWDKELLTAELERLSEDEINLSVIGFSTAELNAMLDLGGDGLDGLDDDGDGEGKQPGEGRGLGTPAITYTIAFDDAEQQAHWFEFLKRLRQADPDSESTIAGRLITFLEMHREEY